MTAFARFFLAIVFLFAPSAGLAQDRLVRVWLHAFIGNPAPDNPAYTRAADGRWLIRAPTVPGTVASLPNHCFTIDGRDFALNSLASARLTFEAKLVVRAKSLVVDRSDGRSFFRTGETRYVDCRSGSEFATPRRASTDQTSVSAVSVSDRRGFVHSFEVKAEAADPFYEIGPINLAPSVRLNMVVSFDSLKQRLRMTGTHGMFPAFEGYYQIGGGAPVQFLRFEPSADAGPLSMLDPRNKAFSYDIMLRRN